MGGVRREGFGGGDERSFVFAAESLRLHYPESPISKFLFIA